MTHRLIVQARQTDHNLRDSPHCDSIGADLDMTSCMTNGNKQTSQPDMETLLEAADDLRLLLLIQTSHCLQLRSGHIISCTTLAAMLRVLTTGALTVAARALLQSLQEVTASTPGVLPQPVVPMVHCCKVIVGSCVHPSLWRGQRCNESSWLLQPQPHRCQVCCNCWT